MKSLLIFLFLSFSFFRAIAQVKYVSPLSCFTWGPDQFLDYETVRRNAPPEVQGPYQPVTSPSLQSYQSFGQDRSIYSWLSDDQHYKYINNVQVIRWTINDQKIPYKITITNLYDEELYSITTENSCGIILFPDSIDTQMPYIQVKIKSSNPSVRLETYNFSLVSLKPRDKDERLNILKELQACNSLECKIEKLKSHHNTTLDILSLLELEKMKDRQNKSIDKLYWEFVSQIRYEFSIRSWER